MTLAHGHPLKLTLDTENSIPYKDGKPTTIFSLKYSLKLKLNWNERNGYLLTNLFNTTDNNKRNCY